MERFNSIPEIFFQEVSETIGNGVTLERVKNVTRLSLGESMQKTCIPVLSMVVTTQKEF